MKIGEYVRTNLGNIGKIIKEYTHKNGQASYPEPQEWILDTGYTLNESLMFESDEDIVKHSNSIIDLIEVGDIVNGERILDITGDYIHTNETDHNRFCLSKHIKTILTKELYEQNCYNLEKEVEQ